MSAPDEDLVECLLANGGSRDGLPGNPAAGIATVSQFLADHSTDLDQPCPYGRTAIAGLLKDADGTTPGDPKAGRHAWAVASATRCVELVLAGCAWSGDLDDLSAKLDLIKPEGGSDWTGILAWAIPNADGEVKCSQHNPDDQGDPLADFWTARKELTLIHQWARARMVAPTAVLGAVLAKICVSTPPDVVLPPTIGKAQGLNAFFALVGTSGSGKGSADGVAADALVIEGECEYTTIGAGSGEGIAHLFANRTKVGVEQHTRAVLMSLSEIDTLIGLITRPGSTILPELRKVWSGERLGFAYVDPAKRITVEEYAYRLALLAGVQPKRARVLFDDESGGTPQRFLWLPATDPDIPDEATPEPTQIAWHEPEAWPPNVGGLRRLPVCSEAVAVVRQAARDRHRGKVDALDGHAVLSRLKVAALLGLLNSRAEVSSEDWRLAGMVMKLSDRTRAYVKEVLTRENQQAGTSRAMEEGRQQVIREAVVTEDGLKRACRAVDRKLRREADWVKGRAVRDVLGVDRSYYQEGLDTLTAAGAIEVEDIEYRGQTGQRIRLAEGTS